MNKDYPLIREVDHLVLGSLLHDIGKVMERGNQLDKYRQDPSQKNSDCPHGSYHALHTRAFCEWLAEKIPLLHPVNYDPQDKMADHWINLASRHHANQKTPLQTQVANADGLASGERESGPYRGGIEKKVRLQSILERVNLNKQNLSPKLRYPLLGLSLEEENLFALPPDQFKIGMKTKHSKKFNRPVLISTQDLTKENQELAEGLLNALQHLPSWTPQSAPKGVMFALVRLLLSQLERFLSYVPSATNIVNPDISLFDHLRVTAAIAEANYWQLKHNQETHSKEAEPWRLVCGDFAGIQTFLYRITAKGAAKGLRGRSFFVELLCDGVAEYLLRRLGLHMTSRLYSSGGRFYLLIPACQEQTLREAVQLVNETLLNHFRGDLFLGLGISSLSEEHFRQGKMAERWKAVNKALMTDRNRRFQSIIENQATFFDPIPLVSEDPQQFCTICGRADQQAQLHKKPQEEERILCQSCDQLENLGRLLTRPQPRTTHLLWLWGEEGKGLSQTDRILLPLPERCAIHLLAEPPSSFQVNDLGCIHLEGLNVVEDCPAVGLSSGFRFVGRWRENSASSTWEFGDFAEQAKNIARYGVLRMDVDNLGEILVDGLNFEGINHNQPEMGSISRWATLSRQLYRFFSGHLNHLLDAHKLDRTQIIYSGGDDLLLIGSWDELPTAGRMIQERFAQYCNNSLFSISAGIALGRDKYPFSRLADQSGAALERAKNFQGGGSKKDAICFLDTVLAWKDFSTMEQVRQLIETIVQETKGNRGIIGRLTETVLTQQELRRLLRQRSLSNTQLQEMLYYHRWRWQLVYSLQRFGQEHTDIRPHLNQLQTFILEDNANLRQPVLDWLQLPVRWADFLTRKEK